jgi:hypothetical protein
MVDKPPSDVFKTASDAWQVAMDQRKFEVALRAGIDAYLHYKAEGNQQLSMGSVSLIHVAISGLLAEDEDKDGERASSPSCSFCGRSGSEARLGAGPDVFICADCVAIFSRSFASNK